MAILFLKTGWMARYQGLKDDPIFSTMSYVKENDYGHERDNFKSKRGKCFGYAPVSGVDIQKAFGAPANAEYIDGVDVIWASNRPKPLGGLVIVGWYRNARVYRHQRPQPSLAIAEANTENCRLLAVDERFYELPLKGPGSFRSTKSWYWTSHPRILSDVQKMLAGTYVVPRGRASISVDKDPDLTRRPEVEKAAVAFVTNHYLELGYHVRSVEKENLGWDLEASGHGLKLLLEVKGTSHSQIMPELTPNEYNVALSQRSCYHLCIVTNALTSSPSLTDLRYAVAIDAWISGEAEIWEITRMTSGKARPRKAKAL